MHGCDHNPFKREIIVRFLKQFVSSVRAIEGVINYFTGGYACSSRHGQRYAARLDPVRKKVRVPFIPLPLFLLSFRERTKLRQVSAIHIAFYGSLSKNFNAIAPCVAAPPARNAAAKKAASTISSLFAPASFAAFE